jgi:hypothetical protein
MLRRRLADPGGPAGGGAMVIRAIVMVSLLALAACATAQTSYSKPGFVTEVKDGRLWVFREGSKDLEEYRKHGELTKMVTRIGAGPNGMTIRAGDAKDIDDYLAAK